jgi:hypothetical protein
MICEISRTVKITVFWVWYHVIWPTYTVVFEDESRQMAEAAGYSEKSVYFGQAAWRLIPKRAVFDFGQLGYGLFFKTP